MHSFFLKILVLWLHSFEENKVFELTTFSDEKVNNEDVELFALYALEKGIFIDESKFFKKKKIYMYTY